MEDRTKRIHGKRLKKDCQMEYMENSYVSDKAKQWFKRKPYTHITKDDANEMGIK